MWALIFTGAWFWILTVVVFIVLVWEVACDKSVKAAFTIALYLLAIHLFGDASLFSAIKTHPEYIYIGIPLFFMVGALWSLVKWWFFVKRSALEYREYRMSWLIMNGISDATLDTPVPERLKNRNFRFLKKPLARGNKGRIITWMVYWPFSMFWTILDEPWRLIYESMARLFQQISDRVWSGLEEDSSKEDNNSDDDERL